MRVKGMSLRSGRELAVVAGSSCGRPLRTIRRGCDPMTGLSVEALKIPVTWRSLFVAGLG